MTLKSRELRDKYVTSSVQLKRMEDNLVRDVVHLWYSSWPATGVPDDAKTVVDLLLEARKGQSKEQQAPIVVHCSPGTGRTGAVLAVDVCMRQLDASRSIDIPRCVHRLRQDRAGCVQTGEQYAFVYKVLSFTILKQINRFIYFYILAGRQLLRVAAEQRRPRFVMNRNRQWHLSVKLVTRCSTH